MFQDDLYAWSLAEATRLDRERDDERACCPVISLTPLLTCFKGLFTSAPSLEDDPARSSEKLRSIRERVRNCSINFQDRVVSICHLAGSHQDLDIRFLAIRIAFNGHYALRKSKASKSART